MNNNDLFQASRRRFLAQLGGLTVAGMLGPSLLTPRRATAAQAATEAVISKEGILTGSHWGAIRATVKDGRFVAAKPFELDKYPSKMIAGLPDHVHNAARIRYPEMLSIVSAKTLWPAGLVGRCSKTMATC